MHLNPFKHIILRKAKCIHYIYALALLCSFSICSAQVKNEEDLKKQASAYFEDEDYNAAYKLYAQLVSTYPKDSEYNYKLGVCMLYTEPDKKKPFMYFQIALKNPTEASKDAKFYLAKTYHVNYKFDEAIKLYTEYKATASSSSIKKLQVDREIAACKNGKRLLSNLSDLVVITKKQLNEADFFRSYDIKDIGGKLLVKPDDFKTGTDKKKKDKSVVYLPRNGERVYFSSYGDGGGNGRDIYFVNRLPNGSWSKPQAMPSSINTEYDEDYPFLHPNGKTLYFSSKGHNSMGGYDVFKTTYNTETQTWSKPQNLDFPINSPDDDILFVTDSLEKTAFFSTGRYSPYGKIDVLKINTERRPMNFAVLKGTVIKEDVAQSIASKITVKNMANGEIVGTYKAQDNGDYNMELPNGGKFIFTVETPGIQTQSEGVQMPIAYSLKPYKQVISYENKILKIINYFDGQIADENYSVMIDLIEKKAKLEVNENEPYNNTLKEPVKNQNGSTENQNLNSVTTTNPTVSSNDNTSKTNTNKNVTNEQLLSMAKMDAVEAENNSKKLKQEAEDAFGLATQKTAEAVAMQKQADEAAATANSITDINKKNEELAKVNILKEDAKMATNVANVATNLAKKLEVDAGIQQKEADLTNQYISQLEAITKNKNNKEALTKLDEIQKQLDDLSKQKNQSDELFSSIKAERELKQNELKKSETKTNEIVNEINLLKNESATLETDLGNENDKSLKENISAQIRELTTDIETKNKELVANNQKIDGLKNEVTGLNKELDIAAKILNEDAGSDASAITTNSTTSGNTATVINQTNASNTSNSLSYAGITSKYEQKATANAIDKTNKKEVTDQNSILKNYNKEIADLVSIDKNELSKTKNAEEKKKLNKEINDLEKQKVTNDKLIASNNNTLNQLNSSTAITTNSNTSANSQNTIATNNTNTSSNQTNTLSIGSDPQLTTTTNTINANNNQTNGNNSSNLAITNSTENVTAVEPISNSGNNNSAYLTELEKIKNALNLSAGSATQIFAYNDYKESTSVTLKQAATQKFETATINEATLNKLIAATEINLKTESGTSSTKLLADGDALNDKAFEQRKESATKTGPEKETLLKEAVNNEKLAVEKKLEASSAQQKENKNKYDVNVLNITDLQKLTGNKSSNDISQANMLTDEAAINYKQAQKIREEANAYPAGAAKLGGLGNAEEKENEALLKQQKAIDLLSKNNPSYKAKTADAGSDPATAIAAVNNEINKTSQSQLEAYLALSKTNQNEIKLQNEKLQKNTAFNSAQNKTAQNLKSEADILNSEAKKLLAQSLTAGNAGEKANLVLKANEKEINALKKLNEANGLLNKSNSSSTTIASNANTVINNSTNDNNANNTTSNTTSANNLNNGGNETTGNSNSNTTVNTSDTNSGNSSNKINNSNATNNTTNNENSNAANNAGNSNNSGTSISGNDNTTNSTSSNLLDPTTTNNSDLSSQISALKSNLNNSDENNLTISNVYENTEAVSLKTNALGKINAALIEDKAILGTLDNVSQLNISANSSQNLNQDAINNSILEAEKMNDEAFNLRKSSVTKSGEEKDKDIQQAKALEEKAVSKKVEAAGNQQKLNAATFEANTKSLEELAAMAKGKNISELSTADMQTTESATYFNQAKKLREETNTYPTDAAKLGGFGNAEEKEALALSKQKTLLDTYKKYFSNYVPKQPVVSNNNPEAVTKLNETKNGIKNNTPLHIDGLLLLSQAIEKEYKSRTASLPAPLKANQLALKTKAQELYKKYQTNLALANQTPDVIKKKNLLIEANKNGQEAITLLSQITNANGTVASVNTVSNNNDSANKSNNGTNNTDGNATQNNSASTNSNSSANKNNTVNTNSATSNNNSATSNNTTANSNQANTSNSTTAGSNNKTNGNNSSPTNKNNTTNAAQPVKLKVEGLEVKTNNAYTANNPIPLDEKMPDGLVFKVQVGAFKSPLPNNTFKGLSPVIAQTTPSGYIRYMAGNFEKYESANAVKNDLKNLGYSDAFVVVYFNGKRINLNEGVVKAQEAGQQVDLSTAENTSAGITVNSNVPKNTFTPPNPNAAIANEQPVDVTNELEKMNGLLYTVQIGVYSKQITRSQLYNLRPIYTEKLPSGLFRYTAGIYNQTPKLIEDKRKVVDLGVKDAFVTSYYNAKRIPFAEAQKLQAENNNLKMENENPIIFSGAAPPINNSVPANTTTPSDNQTNNTPTNTNTTAFNNGVTAGPVATTDNGVKTDEAGISYKVQIGAYKNQIPNDVATKFMNIKTWPVNNVPINGLYIYTIGNFNSSSFAKKLKDEAIAIGITDAFVTVYKDGKKLYGNEASQYLTK